MAQPADSHPFTSVIVGQVEVEKPGLPPNRLRQRAATDEADEYDIIGYPFLLIVAYPTANTSAMLLASEPLNSV